MSVATHAVLIPRIVAACFLTVGRTGSNDEWVVVFRSVHWHSGKEEWDRQLAGREIGVKMASAEGDNVASITRPREEGGGATVITHGGSAQQRGELPVRELPLL